jgi:molybdopterin synthase catalytic subunit
VGIVENARRRFDIRNVRIIHRTGRLDLGAQIVMVAIAASHRHAALHACEFLMDYLKTQAPFWKKTIHRDGSTHWVDARVADDAAAQHWELDAPANA